MPPTGAVMDKFQVLLLSRAFSGVLGPHVFISHWRNWTDAQELSRDQYTDLSPVTCQQDTDQLRQASGGQGQKRWPGLHKAHGNNNDSVWRLSGGGVLDVYWNWVHGEPNSWGGHEGTMEVYSNGRWNDLAQDQERPFYCLSLLVVSHTPLAWEAALEHCRWQRSHLLSMPSDTRHLLADALLRKAHTTQPPWRDPVGPRPGRASGRPGTVRRSSIAFVTNTSLGWRRLILLPYIFITAEAATIASVNSL